jgi:plastocyanin
MVRMDDDVHHALDGAAVDFFCPATITDAGRTQEIDVNVLHRRVSGTFRNTRQGLALLCLLAVTAGTQAAELSPPAGSVVEIVEFMRFEPTTLTVPAGTTVTWINNDGSNHIIQMRSGAKSPRMRHGASYSQRFDTPGEYPYICAIHGERMSGTIIVQAP